MLKIIAIFTGGGIGAVIRYLTGLIILKYSHLSLPPATFIVNVAGSFLIGFLYIFFIEKQELNPAIKLALTVGFCGGLTTFSTFSLELFEMIKNAHFINAFLYVIISIIICVTAVITGAYIAKFCI